MNCYRPPSICGPYLYYTTNAYCSLPASRPCSRPTSVDKSRKSYASSLSSCSVAVSCGYPCYVPCLSHVCIPCASPPSKKKELTFSKYVGKGIPDIDVGKDRKRKQDEELKAGDGKGKDDRKTKKKKKKTKKSSGKVKEKKSGNDESENKLENVTSKGQAFKSVETADPVEKNDKEVYTKDSKLINTDLKTQSKSVMSQKSKTKSSVSSQHSPLSIPNDNKNQSNQTLGQTDTPKKPVKDKPTSTEPVLSSQEAQCNPTAGDQAKPKLSSKLCVPGQLPPAKQSRPGVLGQTNVKVCRCNHKLKPPCTRKTCTNMTHSQSTNDEQSKIIYEKCKQYLSQIDSSSSSASKSTQANCWKYVRSSTGCCKMCACGCKKAGNEKKVSSGNESVKSSKELKVYNLTETFIMNQSKNKGDSASKHYCGVNAVTYNFDAGTVVVTNKYGQKVLYDLCDFFNGKSCCICNKNKNV